MTSDKKLAIAHLEWLLKLLLIPCLLLTLSGCATYMLTHPQEYTPEQIAAYKEVGSDVYVCTAISGPAVNGGFAFLVVPKDAKPMLSFSGNCQLLKAEINAVK